MSPIRLALVGIGKIARDQHVPAIAHNRTFELVSAASPHHKLDGVPNFPTLEALLRDGPRVDAVALCTPPQVRYEIARYALNHRLHVMLEKPPGATLNEVVALSELAARQSVALFATWHSREAAGVETARTWLIQRSIRNVRVAWKEDVRIWHPGQHWIWKPGGLGVFDPGINALSILTKIMPEPLVLTEAELSFPSNCDAPIAANLLLKDPRGVEVHMELDFLQTGPQTWDIDIASNNGSLKLSNGGAVLRIDGDVVIEGTDHEYPRLYERFEMLVRERRVDVDLAPMRLVADAFICGRRVTVAPFVE
jgi:D-galactose 1-dehydrogenase